MREYRGRQRVNSYAEERKPGFEKKLFTQAVVAAIITVFVLTVKLINTGFTNGASDKIKNTLYYTVDYETTVRNMMNYIKGITQNRKNEDTYENDYEPHEQPDHEPDFTEIEEHEQPDIII